VGDLRLHVVPGRRLDRVHEDRAEPERPDLAPRARDRPGRPGHRRFLPLGQPVLRPEGELLYFLSYRNFTIRVDVFEDDHVIPKPALPVAVQLRAGQRPPFEVRDQGGCEGRRKDRRRQGRQDCLEERGPSEGDRGRRRAVVAPLPAPREAGKPLSPEGWEGASSPGARPRISTRSRSSRSSPRPPGRTSSTSTSSTSQHARRSWSRGRSPTGVSRRTASRWS